MNPAVLIFVYFCFQLHVYVTHLSLSQKARERSVVEIWKYMSQHSGPAVLMGDLNAQPDSPEYKWVNRDKIWDMVQQNLAFNYENQLYFHIPSKTFHWPKKASLVKEC